MSRTAYHRAYYYANVERRRASARAARRKAREWQAVIRIVCEAVTDARNENPPDGGLTRQGVCLTLQLRFKRDGSLTDCSSPVNHPTTPRSGLLVGETTRSNTLNLDRGSQPLGTRRRVGKREWQQGKPCEKLPTPGEAPKGSKSNRTSFLGVIPSGNRPGSTTEGS